MKYKTVRNWGGFCNRLHCYYHRLLRRTLHRSVILFSNYFEILAMIGLFLAPEGLPVYRKYVTSFKKTPEESPELRTIGGSAGANILLTDHFL